MFIAGIIGGNVANKDTVVKAFYTYIICGIFITSSIGVAYTIERRKLVNLGITCYLPNGKIAITKENSSLFKGAIRLRVYDTIVGNNE